ncbi:MAG: PilZ domain-containing protein [Planctomycetota bacterium]
MSRRTLPPTIAGIRPTVAAFLIATVVLLGSPPLGAQFDELGPDREELTKSLRLRTSDPSSLWRFLSYAGGALGLAFLIYSGHRLTQKHWPKPSSRSSRRLSGWQRTLQGHGLDPNEREFMARLGNPHGIEPVSLVGSRTEFERAVELSQGLLQGDPRLERLLGSVRRKLGWDGPADLAPAAAAPAQATPGRVPSLELNQEVEVFGTGDHAGFCARAILVHRDDQNLVFRMLEAKDELPFDTGEKIQLYFWRSNDAGYLCLTDVREVRQKGPGFLITMVPHAVERQQKRIYVRVPYGAEIRYLHVPLRSASEMLGSETNAGGLFDGVCEDLSAGGFRLITQADLQPGDYLSIPDFEPANNEEIMARVVAELESLDDGRRRFGLQYTGIPMPMRDAINRLVFAVQRRTISDAKTASTPETPEPVTDPVVGGEPTDESAAD